MWYSHIYFKSDDEERSKKRTPKRVGGWCEPDTLPFLFRSLPSRREDSRRRRAVELSREGCVSAKDLFESVRGTVSVQFEWYRGYIVQIARLKDNIFGAVFLFTAHRKETA